MQSELWKMTGRKMNHLYSWLGSGAVTLPKEEESLW